MRSEPGERREQVRGVRSGHGPSRSSEIPRPGLKLVSEPIAEVTDELRQLARDMCEVMYDEPGIGLAAPQVGAAVRMIVVDTEWTEEGATSATRSSS